jgi:myo-inositol-1(or 4)-monophosphatase
VSSDPTTAQPQQAGEPWWNEALRVAIDAAHAGANELMARCGNAVVREKSPRDLVTDADTASQEAIRTLVGRAFPEFNFIGEEDTAQRNGFAAPQQADRPCWVVDPLDGTANYVHRLQNFAVSIALIQNGRPVVGVVLDPVYEECFTVVRGQGSRCDEAPIRVSGCDEIEQALIAFSFSANVRRDSPEVAQFTALLERAQAVRRLGSAALNLCYVAAGRLDGYWAPNVKPWDIAAGALLVEEAGGILTGVSGRPFNVWTASCLAAATGSLHEQMRQATSMNSPNR